MENLWKPGADWWRQTFLPGLVLFTVVVIAAYYPTLAWVVGAWMTEPDYSHGFLVIPLAYFILSWRWDTFPGLRKRLSYAGLSLIALAIVMRIAGRMVYADFLDGWSLIPLLVGSVWFLWGPRVTRWALPALFFLILMIPMPYQAESLLSWKLQGVATQLSTGMLRVLGQPAVSEGHLVWIGEEKLMVEQACSGLRIFVGVGALAYFWAAVANRCWLDRVIILVSAIPLAILANSVRIALIGVLYIWVKDFDSRNFVHDITGFLMIPMAFGLLWLVKSFWESAYRPVEQMTVKDLMPVDQPQLTSQNLKN